MIRLIVIRHGESLADLEPTRIEGQADFPLSEKGEQQVRALAARIAAEYQLGQLISSPLKRAHQTAQAVSAACGLPETLEPRLMERSSGVFGGLTPAEARERYPQEKMPWEIREHETSPEGETFLQQHARVADFWFSLYYGQGDRTVAVVAHGGTINILYQLALGLPPRNRGLFLNDDTGVHEWQVEPGGAVLIRRHNCTRHLR